MVWALPEASLPLVAILVVIKSPATTVSPLPVTLPPACLQAALANPQRTRLQPHAAPLVSSLDNRGLLASLDLTQALSHTIAMLVPYALRKNIEFSFDGPESCIVVTDKQALFSIINNILNNAVKYCPPDSQAEVSLDIMNFGNLLNKDWGQINDYGFYATRRVANYAGIDPTTGKGLDALAMPHGVGLSGLESDGAELFYCGDGAKSTLRAVRRPKRA